MFIVLAYTELTVSHIENDGDKKHIILMCKLYYKIWVVDYEYFKNKNIMMNLMLLIS